MSYYVGKDRLKVESMRDAYRIAAEIMREKVLGDCVNIYIGPKSDGIAARIEVRPDRNGVRRFVVYRPNYTYGRALTVDYQPKGDKFTNIHR